MLAKVTRYLRLNTIKPTHLRWLAHPRLPQLSTRRKEISVTQLLKKTKKQNLKRESINDIKKYLAESQHSIHDGPTHSTQYDAKSPGFQSEISFSAV